MDLSTIDSASAWGARSDDPQWYNRKQAIQFGRRVYPQGGPMRGVLIVHFEHIVFSFRGRVIDADGREHASLCAAVTHYRSQHPEFSVDDMALGVVFQGSPLGRRAA